MQSIQFKVEPIKQYFIRYFSVNSKVILENPRKVFFTALGAQGLLLLLYTFGNLIVSYSVNFQEIQALNLRYSKLFEQRNISPFLYSMNTYPYTIFWSVFFIYLFQFFSIGVKTLILKGFSEKNSSFWAAGAIELVSFSRFILCLFPILLYARVYPQSWKQELIPLIFYTSIYMITLLLGLWYFLQNNLKLSIETFLLPKGRAFFILLSPLLIVGVMIMSIMRP